MNKTAVDFINFNNALTNEYDVDRMDDTCCGSELTERERMNDLRSNCEIVAYRLTQKGHYMPLFHSHSYYEFIIILKADRVVFSNTGGSIEGSGRCVCFHNAHVLHRNNVPENVLYDRIVLYVKDSAFSQIGGTMGSIGTLSKEGTAIIDFKDEKRIPAFKRIENYLSELMADGISEDKKRLLTALIVCEIKESATPSYTKYIVPVHTYIKDVAEYISLNYKENITTPILASRFFVSVNKLNRDFKKYTGTTIRQYVISVRMKYAQALLAEGVSAGAAAEACGFESLSYFVQSFKQYAGTTPRTYSKKMIDKNI